LVICVLVFAAAMIAGTVAVGAAAVAQQRAQGVADVVALAAANDTDTAPVVAGRNGAGLLDLIVGQDGSVGVTVQLAGQRARAAARTG
jgi:hypothetical protein